MWCDGLQPGFVQDAVPALCGARLARAVAASVGRLSRHFDRNMLE
jgi:hypothetical protein